MSECKYNDDEKHARYGKKTHFQILVLRWAPTTLSHSNLWHCILELVGCVFYLLLLKDFSELSAQMRNLIYDLEVVFSTSTKFVFMCFLYFSLHNQLLQHIMLRISFVLSQPRLTQSVFLPLTYKIAALHPWLPFQQLFHRNQFTLNTADKSYVEHPRRGYHFYSYCVIFLAHTRKMCLI